MSRVNTLVVAAACAVAALSAGAGRAEAFSEARELVTGLTVRAAGARTEAVIAHQGTVRLTHFTLTGPHRIVVDLTGPTVGLPAKPYDRVNRGGIVDVRWSQWKPNVVRVVLTVDKPRQYTIERATGSVTISVKGDAEGAFAAWQTGSGDERAVAQREAPAERPAPAPARDTQADQERVAAARAAQARDAEARDAEARQAKAAAEAAEEKLILTDATVGVTLASSGRERPTMQQRIQQPRISVAWNEADIREVLAQFAAFSGRTIIVGRGVRATITAEIIDQPWDVAMAAILASQGLAATEDASGIIVVDTYENISARRTSEPLATRTIRLNYSRAPQVAANLRQRLTRDCSRAQGGQLRQNPGTLTDAQSPQPEVGLSGPVDLNCPIRGAVTADTLTNSVSITDVPGALTELVNYARSLDVRQPQVAIKAKIVLVDRTSLEALGLRYDLGTRNHFFNTLLTRQDENGNPIPGNGQFILGGNTLAGIANASQAVPNAALSLIYSATLGRFDFTTFLDALQEVSLLDVQSEPSIVTMNNVTAELRAGVEVPIRVIEANTGAGGAGDFPRATVQLRQTGIILNVTPQITANRQIIMRIVAENSDVDFRSGDVGAVFPTQRVENQLLVADGETAVMGGLTQTRVSVTKSGIPILVDLPLIGRLFGVTNRAETKRDLLILITPHIVDEGQTLPDGFDDR